MDKRLQSIKDNYDKMKIGVDKQFQFHCRMCGKCCINRDDILLSPKDIYKISKELNLKPSDVVSRYCETYIGSSSKLPIVRLKPQGAIKRCPLLKDNRCSVHNVKPTVCAMFPIGRGLMVECEKDLDTIDASKIEYIFVNPTCGDKRETHTVREWLGKFGIPLEDEYFVKWQRTISTLGIRIHKLIEMKCPETLMSEIWDCIYAVLYLSYNTEQEFVPQFESNSKDIIKLISDLIDSASEKISKGN